MRPLLDLKEPIMTYLIFEDSYGIRFIETVTRRESNVSVVTFSTAEDEDDWAIVNNRQIQEVTL